MGFVYSWGKYLFRKKKCYSLIFCNYSYALQRESGSNGGKMQATIGCLSRMVGRTLVSTTQTTGQSHPQQQHNRTRACSTSSTETSSSETEAPLDHARLVTAVSGFPKASAAYNIDHILKGQIGDDAYFIARHLDDWSSPTSTSSGAATAEAASTPQAQPASPLPYTTTRKCPTAPPSPTVGHPGPTPQYTPGASSAYPTLCRMPICL